MGSVVPNPALDTMGDETEIYILDMSFHMEVGDSRLLARNI